MPMHEFDENYFQFIGHTCIEKHAQRSFAIAQLLKNYSGRLTLAGCELRRVPPKLLLIERTAIPKSNYQRGVDSLQLSGECIGDENLWMLRKIAIAAVLGGKDEKHFSVFYLPNTQRGVKPPL